MAKKILIAEDDRSVARALENKLKHSGYDVVLVSDGEQAIAALRNVSYDLLLLDIMMPKKDGYGVLEDMKAGNISTPTVVLSNLGQAEEVKKAKALGAKDYFVKADTPLMKVIEIVEKVLNS